MKNLSDSNQFIRIAENIYDDIIFDNGEWKNDHEDTISKTVPAKDIYNFKSSVSAINDKLREIRDSFETECIRKIPGFFDIDCGLLGKFRKGTNYTVTYTGKYNGVDFIEACEKAIREWKKVGNKKPNKKWVTLREDFTSNLYPDEEFFSDVPRELVLEFNYNKKLYKDCQEYLNLYNHIKESKNLSFKELYDYSQFLRWAGKAILYNNSDTNYIFSDQNLDTTMSRLLCIQKENLLIVLDLSTTRDSLSNEYIDEIKIDVKKGYGKESEFHFVVIDQDCHYKDDSDLYLMNSINQITVKAVSKSFEEIIKSIINQTFSEIGDINDKTD